MRDSVWVRVSRGSPCPICDKPDWCTVASDGSAACCMRTESERRLGNGGWLHRLGQDLFGVPVRSQAAPPSTKRYLSADAIGKTFTQFARTTTDEQVAGLANKLGVTPEALRAIGAFVYWVESDEYRTVWGFPMFDGPENFAGIRLRSDDGDKWALRGGRQGIFIPDMELESEVLVVEGPTDAAAAVSLGFYAIGRPSCTGGVREIAALCQRMGIKRLSVLADNDGPGISGARAFCGQIGLPARLVVTPAKDLREWVKNGATRQAVEVCLAAANWN